MDNVLSVAKMRLSALDVMLRECTIEAPAGLAVREAAEIENGVLAELARGQEGAAAGRARVLPRD